MDHQEKVSLALINVFRTRQIVSMARPLKGHIIREVHPTDTDRASEILSHCYTRMSYGRLSVVNYTDVKLDLSRAVRNSYNPSSKERLLSTNLAVSR